MTTEDHDKQGGNAETLRPEGPASERPKTASALLAQVVIPEAPKAPVDLVVAGVGESIDDAFNDMLFGDEKPQPAPAVVNPGVSHGVSPEAQAEEQAEENVENPELDEAPTYIKKPSYAPELEQGQTISIDDLDDEIREDVFLDDAFHNWEHGPAVSPSSLPPTGEIPKTPAPQAVLPPIPAPLPTTNNLPTMPAPAAPLRIPSNPVDVDVDLDDDSGPRAGVFRVPHLLPPSFTVTPLLQGKTNPSINDKETVMPPPRLQNPSSIPISVESEDEDRITADFTADAAIVWSFTQSPFFREYEEASAEYERAVKTNPALIKPEYATYLARFRASQEKD